MFYLSAQPPTVLGVTLYVSSVVATMPEPTFSEVTLVLTKSDVENIVSALSYRGYEADYEMKSVFEKIAGNGELAERYCSSGMFDTYLSIDNTKKIAAIKFLRMVVPGLGLSDAKYAIDYRYAQLHY